jgi:hypothetical protein
MATLNDLPSQVISRTLTELRDKLPAEIERELVDMAASGKILDAKVIAGLVTRYADRAPINGD